MCDLQVVFYDFPGTGAHLIRSALGNPQPSHDVREALPIDQHFVDDDMARSFSGKRYARGFDWNIEKDKETRHSAPVLIDRWRCPS